MRNGNYIGPVRAVLNYNEYACGFKVSKVRAHRGSCGFSAANLATVLKGLSFCRLRWVFLAKVSLVKASRCPLPLLYNNVETEIQESSLAFEFMAAFNCSGQVNLGHYGLLRHDLENVSHGPPVLKQEALGRVLNLS